MLLHSLNHATLTAHCCAARSAGCRAAAWRASAVARQQCIEMCALICLLCLVQVAIIQSKRLRNKIAGFTTVSAHAQRRGSRVNAAWVEQQGRGSVVAADAAGKEHAAWSASERLGWRADSEVAAAAVAAQPVASDGACRSLGAGAQMAALAACRATAAAVASLWPVPAVLGVQIACRAACGAASRRGARVLCADMVSASLPPHCCGAAPDEADPARPRARHLPEAAGKFVVLFNHLLCLACVELAHWGALPACRLRCGGCERRGCRRVGQGVDHGVLHRIPFWSYLSSLGAVWQHRLGSTRTAQPTD